MKFVLIAILAAFSYTTIVSAAPKFKKSSFNLQMNEGFKVDLLSWKFPKSDQWNDYTQCYVNFLDEVSKANGLGEMWYLYGKQIQIHINDWKKCGKDKYCNYIKQRLGEIAHTEIKYPMNYFGNYS